MQKTYGLSADYTKREINRYYSDRNMIKPKIANKAAVFGLLKSGKSLETIIEVAKSHIPDAYIQEYLNKTGEIDITQIKKIVNKQLVKLSNEGNNPDYIAPFDFANMIKSKGHNTKYQAVALLYKLIKDNNLDFKETLSNINNEEITSALNILLNTNNASKKEHMDLINNNNLALTIFSEEQQEEKEKEKANEDDSILLK